MMTMNIKNILKKHIKKGKLKIKIVKTNRLKNSKNKENAINSIK